MMTYIFIQSTIGAMVLNKKVILALSLQSFILLQLYVPQAASQRCSKKSEIVFVVDQSGSITDANPRNGSWDNWSLIKDFISQIIRNTEIGYNGVHVGLVTFGNIGVTRFRLLDYLDANSLIAAVRAIPPGQGQTNLYAGLNLACTDVLNVVNNARPDVPQIIIVITDGKANINTEMTIPQAQACQASGVRIFAVGVTQSIDEEQLKQVSSPPHTLGSSYWTTPDFTSLASIVASVQQATCDPPKEIFDGCRTMDICFAIDVPQTMSDYVKVKNFINRFITLYLEIGVNAVRVCIITFDNRQATLQIPLNKYYDEDSFKMALDELPFVPSNYGDPAYALQLASNTAFSALNGARGSNFKPTLITMLNNGIQNRATVIDAFNTLYNRGIRSIGIGMTSDISESEVQLLTYIGTDVLSSIGYDYLSTQVQYLSYILCRNSSYVLCPIAAEICLALDQSTSILAAPGGYDNWKVHILGFAKSLAGAFPIGPTDTRVSVVQFSTGAGVSFQLYQHTTRPDLIAAIDKLEAAGGDTNIAGALRACRSDAFRYARPSVPLIVLLVTDGKANIDATRTMVEANATKALGANVFTIGITNNVDVNQLRQIASFPPETHYFFASDFSKLRSIVIDVLQKSCNVPGTGSTIRVGSSTTSISSSRSSLLSSTTSSTTSRPTQSQTSTPRQPTTTSTGTSCQSGLDLVLILDESTSIVYAPGNYDNWYKYILGFSTDILDAFDIGPTKTQVGVIKFSENAYASIYLNDYKDKTSLKRAVQSLDIRGGETNIAAAFRVTRTLLYSSSHGARPNVARVAILLTDGAPNRERNFTQSEADLLKALGVRLFTVGVTDMTNSAELKRLCSQPSDTYFYYVNDYSQLSTIVKRVLATTCNDVVPIVQTTTSPPRSATVATTKPPSSTVRSGASTTANRVSTTASVAKGCEAVADIVLLLDESTSIVFSESGYDSWYVNILGFLKEICRSFHISTTATRFAVVKFSGSYTISMKLNAYDTIDKLTHAIDQLDINGGETNLALPLRIARTVVLPEGRSNAKKVIVLLTDGVANREVNMTTKEADLCKQSGIEIFTVGVSSMISPLQLQTIASTPVSTHYYYAAKFNQLQNIVGMLSRSICQSVQRVP